MIHGCHGTFETGNLRTSRPINGTKDGEISEILNSMAHQTTEEVSKDRPMCVALANNSLYQMENDEGLCEMVAPLRNKYIRLQNTIGLPSGRDVLTTRCTYWPLPN